MMLMREAARETERLAGLSDNTGNDRLATLAGVASELVAKASDNSSLGQAPEILVVPNTDR